MHFLRPDKFALEEGTFDLEGGPCILHALTADTLTRATDEEKEAKIKDLHSKLSSLMLRRLKKDVVQSLPTKTEKILRVEMSEMQMRWYKLILAKVRMGSLLCRAGGLRSRVRTQNYEALAASNSRVSLLNIAMELKKASNHPFLFPGAEPTTDQKEEALRGLVVNSGKMILLDKLLVRLKSEGHRVLIFSQMVRML